MKKLTAILFTTLSLLFAMSASAAEKYIIDTKGAHASINFKIKHLGYSWLTGRFNDFDGEFSIDRDNLEKSSIIVNIDPASVDSNHAERDKHLRSDDFLDVEKFKQANFVSTAIEKTGENTAIVHGDLTLHGVTKKIAIDSKLTGEGKDPWGGYRIGFEGTTKIALKDFNIEKDLGPASTEVDLHLYIEGIRQ